MTVRDQVVAGARRWLGTPYDWGGEGENGEGVDCSGLVISAFRAAGAPLSGRPVASQLGRMGQAVTIAQAVPGDVVYYDEPGPTDHVGIYIGNGQMIDAPHAGASVRVDNVGTPTSIRRILDGAGSAWSDRFGGTAEEQLGFDPGDAVKSVFIPGYGLLDQVGLADAATSSWAGEALAIGVKLVGTIAALALVVAGVIHTVKDG